MSLTSYRAAPPRVTEDILEGSQQGPGFSVSRVFYWAVF